MHARLFYLVLTFLFSSSPLLYSKPLEQPSSKIRHIILLVDYIAGDYKEAIEQPGIIKNPDEYAEMLEFSKLISEMYLKEKKSSDAVQKEIYELAKAIQNKSNKDKVKKLALNLRRSIVAHHELSVVLKQFPNLKKVMNFL